MVHRITVNNSRHVASGNAFDESGPDALIVDPKAHLIADNGYAALLTGTWTVTINGVVGTFLNSGGWQGLLMFGGPASTVTIGKTGGSDGDSFFYFNVSDSGTKASKRDVITDFQPGADAIHLLNVDANGNAPGHGGFTFIGTDRFGGNRGELQVSYSRGDTIVAADVNGDRKADFSILLKGHHLLDVDDFVI